MKAMLNYNMKQREIQINTENQVDQLRLLFSIKNESLLIFNKCVLMNEEILTNVSYNEIYRKNLLALEKEISAAEERVLSRKRDDEKK